MSIPAKVVDGDFREARSLIRIAISTPAVKFVDSYAPASSSIGQRRAAAELGAGPSQRMDWQNLRAPCGGRDHTVSSTHLTVMAPDPSRLRT
jgi:hypothetical protein